MSGETKQRLYWTGGPFNVAILHPDDAQLNSINDAIRLLERFRSECQMQYMAFSRIIGGRTTSYEEFRRIFQPQHHDAMFSVGSAFPNGEQSPGNSTIAQIRQGELLVAMAPGGAFERAHAAAFIVFVYTLWEENYRPRIGDAFGVRAKNTVQCDLMGELRHVRHWIIHENSVVPSDWSSKCPMLSQLWGLSPGELAITEKMLHSLMEQVNALRVRVKHEC